MPTGNAKHKLLLIDDEQEILDIIKMKLQARGYLVDTLLTGRGAVEQAKRLRPDLILLDHRMPGMGGPEVCRLLKADPQTQAIPVIMFTAAMAYGLEAECIGAGAETVVYKPFIADLLEAVKTLLSGQKIDHNPDDNIV